MIIISQDETNKQTKSKQSSTAEQSTNWKDNSSLASQGARILLKPKVHYYVDKSSFPLPFLNQINPVLALLNYP